MRTLSRPCLLATIVMTAALSTRAAAQCPTKACNPALLARRTLIATRISGTPPTIDGHLDEPAWAEAPVATDFVESTPRPAAPAGLRSEARVLADAQAIYVALTFFDPQPERIQAPLARRDDETTGDWAFVEIDSRYDRRTAFSLGINPRNVQVDGLWLSDIDYDTSWDGVWQSAANIDDRGWTAEFRIPFSQLSFRLPPEGGEMVWGINFYRYSPGHGESSNWSPRYRGLGGIVTNFNDLRVPAPPRVQRFEVTPYVAPRLGRETPLSSASAINAGADLKTGVGSNFNLTATVLPDFGQVEADPSQVNLTAFELFQAERRPFFLSGVEVFRFNTSLAFTSRGLSFAEESPFYSRRVGRAPRGEPPPGATLDARPIATTLLGAAKLSGQTARGWTLGVFTALTDRERGLARFDDGSSARLAIEPRGLVTVGRAIKRLNQGESSLGFFAANTHRFVADADDALAQQLVRDEAAAGVETQHRFGGRAYELRSWMLASRVSGDPAAVARIAESSPHYFQRPDAPRLHERPYGSSLDGAAMETRVSRVSGAFRWDLVGRAVSPGFDVNEIGFQRSADWVLGAGTWRHERFRPGRWIRAWTIGSDNVGVGWSWAGERRAAVVNGFASLDWRNYWSMKVSAAHEGSSLSMEHLRGGPALLLPPRDALVLSLKTDVRRPSYLWLDASASRERDSGSWAVSLSPLLNLRMSDRVQWSIGPRYQLDTIGWQYVGRVDAPVNAAPRTDYITGRVAQRTLALTGRADLVFSPRLVLQFYAEPFGTVGRYDRFQRLLAPRAADPLQRFARLEAGDDAWAHIGSPDAQQRALNGSVVLRWEYRPASFLTLVWNQRRDGMSADIGRSTAGVLGDAFHDHGTNVVLMKISMRVGA